MCRPVGRPFKPKHITGAQWVDCVLTGELSQSTGSIIFYIYCRTMFDDDDYDDDVSL